MRKFLTTLILTTTLSLAFGQQKTLAKFIISDATDNKEDVTETALLTGQYLVFYTTAQGELYMANVRPKIQNSQSYGRLYAAETKSLNETYETYKADIFYFRWRYINDYDSKKGTATVKFMKIYKPQGVTFILTMIPENLDVLIYKGYMEGSLDFSDYSN
jgi:hypothetical protein